MNKSISKNIIFKFLLNAFNLVVPILIGPYVLRALGPELMGVINFSQSIFGYFFIFAGFGVYQYGLREISRVRDNKEKLSKVFTNLFIFTLITNVITTVLYVVFIKQKYAGTEIYTACMILTFNLLSNIFYTEWVNEALESYDFITIKTIAVRVVYLILLFTMVRTANDFKQYMYLLVLSTFLNNIISYVYIKKRIKLNLKELQLARHIKPMFLVVILSNANVLYTQLDRLMLGEYVSTLVVGYYTTAQNISGIINTLLLTVIHVTIPRLSNYIAKENNTEYISLLDRISKIYFLVLFPTAIGIFMLSKEIILLYGGSEYVAATPMLVVFALYIISLGYEGILSNQIMYIKGREKQQVNIIFICGAINLSLNIILLTLGRFNGTTAIATTLLSNIIVVLLEHLYIKYKLKIEFNIFAFDKTKYLLISLIFVPITIIIKRYISGVVLVSLLTIGANGLIYIFILLAMRDKVFLEVINKILGKLKIKTIK